MSRSAEIRLFLAQVVNWAKVDPNILGVVLVGSYARGEAGPESDVDLVIITETPAALLANTEWTGAFGEALESTSEDWGKVQSVRVRYETGPEIEFGITGRDWLSEPLDSGTAGVLRDGAEILFERVDYVSARFQRFSIPHTRRDIERC